MPLEAATEMITLNSRGNGESIQLLTEGDMIVPDINPDIYQILKADEEVIIDKVKTEQGRINFSGRLRVSVLYYGKKTECPVNFMKSDFSFEDYIVSDDITEDTDADIVSELIHTDYRLVNDRKINVKAITGVNATWNNEKEVEAVKEVTGDDSIQLKMGMLDVGNVKERNTEEFTVREELKLPVGKPDAAEIVETTAEICHRDIRTNGDTVSISGDFKISVVYIGAGEAYALDSAEFIVPFNGNVNIPMADNNTVCMARMQINNVASDIAADSMGEPRVIDVQITVGVVIKSFSHKGVSVLEDAYSLASPLDITRKDINYMKVIGRNKAQGVFRNIVTADSKQPDIMQIVKVWGNIRNARVSVKDNAVEADGVADIKVMYIAKDDDEPLNVISASLPFSQEIEIKGITENSLFDMTAEIEDISFSTLSEREAEVRATISSDVVASENQDGSIITGISEAEAGEENLIKSGAVIYTVKKGDTLWNIAKKYNTTVADIVRLNKIENPDLIYPCQKLLILKKFV
ncbi:MAG: DUF3794 domain-containing protein [Candidatus Metalachnospira sp.]|nr:DUF3794 domain-containing protein [Candidatus Metalachnospira sp.]